MLGANSSDRETNGRVSGRAGDLRRRATARRRRSLTACRARPRPVGAVDEELRNRHTRGTPRRALRGYARRVGGGFSSPPTRVEVRFWTCPPPRV